MFGDSPLWVMEMLDSYWYRVSKAVKPNMLSLAFRFNQITEPRRDPTGLSPLPDDRSEEVDEAELAIEILRKSESLEDLDQLLIDNKDLYDEMVEKSMRLLGPARYPIKEYIPWAAKKQNAMMKRLRD